MRRILFYFNMVFLLPAFLYACICRGFEDPWTWNSIKVSQTDSRGAIIEKADTLRVDSINFNMDMEAIEFAAYTPKIDLIGKAYACSPIGTIQKNKIVDINFLLIQYDTVIIPIPDGIKIQYIDQSFELPDDKPLLIQKLSSDFSKDNRTLKGMVRSQKDLIPTKLLIRVLKENGDTIKDMGPTFIYK